MVRELSFRVNFITRSIANLGWLVFMYVFFKLIFQNTNSIGDWNEDRYLFFLGTSFLINALINGLFLQNCTRFAELIRTGDLDTVLVKPVDEQFFLSLQRVDWSEFFKIPFAFFILGYSMNRLQIPFDLLTALNYLVLVAAGVCIFYSLMLTLACTSVWIVRNRGLYEMWFYVTQFSRYPSDIYTGNLLGWAISVLLTFMLPILLAINIPARVGVQMVTPGWSVAYLLGAAVVIFALARWFLFFALKHYRSASS